MEIRQEKQAAGTPSVCPEFSWIDDTPHRNRGALSKGVLEIIPQPMQLPGPKSPGLRYAQTINAARRHFKNTHSERLALPS